MGELLCGEERKRIGVYLHLVPGNGGSYQYVEFILDALVAWGQHQVVVMYVESEWENILIERYALFERRALVSQEIGRQVDALQCDYVICPMDGETACISLSFHTPLISVVHDIMCYYEQGFSVHGDRGFSHVYQAFCRQAIGVLVDSELGKQQLLEVCGRLYESKIFILPFRIPNYLSDTNAPVLPCELQNKRYIFYPAQFWYHKNHLNLLLAVELLKSRGICVNLLFTGSNDKVMYKQLIRIIRNLGLNTQVEILGYVNGQQMKYLYQHARAMIMPTYDGPTNIPPLEAMALDCPMAVSNIYAMPEQVGEAGLFFNPESVEDIANTLQKLWLDDDTCKKLISAGRVQRNKYSKDNFNKRFQNIISSMIRQEHEMFPFLKDLEKECKKYGNVYLYGAGDYGYWIYQYLHAVGIKIKGFIVSDKTKVEGNYYLRVPVYQIDEVNIEKESDLVVLALYSYHHAAVLSVINNYCGDVDYYRVLPEHRLECFAYCANRGIL